MTVFVIRDEQHSLFSEQDQILKDQFGIYEEYPVSANGWKLTEMKEHIDFLARNADIVVFASPIPYVLKRLSEIAVLNDQIMKTNDYKLKLVYVFHNDNREKKELPNGKIIQTVAKTGWQLI